MNGTLEFHLSFTEFFNSSVNRQVQFLVEDNSQCLFMIRVTKTGYVKYKLQVHHVTQQIISQCWISSVGKVTLSM